MSDLASQFKKTMMAHTFLERIDQLLTVAHASLAKDPHLAVTAIFQTWLQWFKTMGSGVEWPELATVKRECCQLYKQYKEEEWVRPFDIHFEQIEEMFTDKRLATLLHWQKASTVVDTGLGAGMKLEKAKGKVTVSLAKRQEYKCMQGAEEVTSGSSRGAKAKSKEWVESNEDGGNNGTSPASVASAKRPQTVASKEGEGDMEMRETTPLAMVAEVEREASNMEVEGKEEFEAAPAAIKEDEEEERAEEVKGTWSDTPLRQVGDDELEWLGEDLDWPTPLTSVALLADFNERAAGVERQFQRELEAAREELLTVRAHYTVAKQTLVTLAGYWCDCQAFLAWQEENNIGEGDWEEAEDPVEVSDDDADLDA
ncbi:hypothetical protein C0989_007047 [Termitomyces sp. Mn162]|nr:hypothetical protein C0989_007047 [Termitomyces sp. Mn162]